MVFLSIILDAILSKQLQTTQSSAERSSFFIHPMSWYAFVAVKYNDLKNRYQFPSCSKQVAQLKLTQKPVVTSSPHSRSIRKYLTSTSSCDPLKSLFYYSLPYYTLLSIHTCFIIIIINSNNEKCISRDTTYLN